MTHFLKGTAKRLTFSLLALSALGGCAVYGTAPGPYTYYGTDANGQAIYAAPYATAPVYTAPYYTAPYYYGPAYVGPPLSLNFGFGYWSGGGRGGGRGGFHGGGRGGGGRGGGGRH
ncbi:hypothetical protein B2J88_25710 [Rhodococcus sp. SRB_17]|nr:hypothetical protein [Rhodococcus sp. SRB_17]